MKRTLAALIVGLCLSGGRIRGQTVPEPPLETTACDIANDPNAFVGKLVRVRAQVWPDQSYNPPPGKVADRAWLYGATRASLDEVERCGFLPARFTMKTDLAGETYTATFTGRVAFNPLAQKVIYPWRNAGKSAKVILLIESETDPHDPQLPNGPVRSPFIYDQQSNSFVSPE